MAGAILAIFFCEHYGKETKWLPIHTIQQIAGISRSAVGHWMDREWVHERPLSNPSEPLVFPCNFNRISVPDSNSCSGCHNELFVGGGGDHVTDVFVLAQRFDFVTFDRSDTTFTHAALDERGEPVTLQNIANERKTIGMNGSGFIEMLARQMTTDLQTIRNATVPGTSHTLVRKGVSFRTLSRRLDGTWDASGVQGLPLSLASADASHPPSLIIMPFHQAGAAISLRQFTNKAFPHHHGKQPEERVGIDVDEDGGGFANELPRADIPAVTDYQVTLPVPGRVIPDDPDVVEAIHRGEQRFSQLGCASCHIAELPLVDKRWNYTEPNPFNPSGNLPIGGATDSATGREKFNCERIGWGPIVGSGSPGTPFLTVR
jgi:hypothetical protein